MITPDQLSTPDPDDLLNREKSKKRGTTRGRPCPNVVDGSRCNGNSEVLNVRQEPEQSVRWRRCLDCGHRWKTREIDEG